MDVADPSALSMLTSMLPEGCEGMSGQEISDTFEGAGAWLKVYETPHGVAAVLHSLNHTASTVFPLFAKVLTEATFPAEPLESLKQKAAADKRLALERPSYRAAVATRKALYGDSPLGRVITPESIMAVDRQQLVAMHRNLLLSQAPDIYIAGKIDNEILSEIDRSFGSLHFDVANPSIIKYQPVEPCKPVAIEEIKVDMPASIQTAIKFHIPTIGQQHSDFESLRMAVMVLGGYFGSRLMNNLREEHGYTYGVSAQLVTQADAASISITCDCDNRYARACVDEIKKEIRRLAEEPVSLEEFDTARQVVVSSLASLLDSAITIEAYREMLALNRLTESALAKRFEAVMALTPADIQRAAATYLLDAPGVIALAGGK